MGLNLATSLCGHSNGTSNYVKGQNFVRVKDTRVLKDMLRLDGSLSSVGFFLFLFRKL